MTSKGTILIVDDDQSHRTMLHMLLKDWGYQTAEADDGSVAIQQVQQHPFDLILMDVRMLKVSGLEALQAIKLHNPAIPVIIMTAYSSVETAVASLKAGAYDYLTKPLDFDKLRLNIGRAMEHLHLQAENRWLKEALGRSFDRHHIIGQSPGILNLLQMVAQVAVSEATVLITGESGTGKELIAGAIHFNSQRKTGPFIKFNCAAITESLLESELFGHEKGAFTGADRRREGRFRQADGGTLLLDEVSEMSLTMQAKLLRVLQEREVTRVGGEDVLPVDVRVLAATNRNLKDMVDADLFREDLYYRLNVVNLHLPPLRARVEDIPLLAQRFLEKFTLQNKKNIKGFSPQAMDRLLRHQWPGNVRELMNAIERATVLTSGEFVDTDYLPPAVRSDEASGALTPNATAAQVPLEEVEKAAILNTLEAVQGNKSEAARRLGITRKTLHNKLKSYG